MTDMHTTIDTFSQPSERKFIIIPTGQSLSYLAILQEDAQLDFDFTVEQDAKATIKILCIGQDTHRIQSNIMTTLSQYGAQADVYILSLLKDGSDLHVHGNIILAPDVAKVSGHLLEENIILGEKIKIRTAPILDVRSSDVSASHGCRVERLDPKRLFYMQSRGLTPSESQSLILDGYLNAMFEWFDLDEEIIQEIKQKII